MGQPAEIFTLGSGDFCNGVGNGLGARRQIVKFGFGAQLSHLLFTQHHICTREANGHKPIQFKQLMMHKKISSVSQYMD